MNLISRQILRASLLMLVLLACGALTWWLTEGSFLWTGIAMLSWVLAVVLFGVINIRRGYAKNPHQKLHAAWALWKDANATGRRDLERLLLDECVKEIEKHDARDIVAAATYVEVSRLMHADGELASAILALRNAVTIASGLEDMPEAIRDRCNELLGLILNARDANTGLDLAEEYRHALALLCTIEDSVGDESLRMHAYQRYLNECDVRDAWYAEKEVELAEYLMRQFESLPTGQESASRDGLDSAARLLDDALAIMADVGDESDVPFKHRARSDLAIVDLYRDEIDRCEQNLAELLEECKGVDNWNEAGRACFILGEAASKREAFGDAGKWFREAAQHFRSDDNDADAKAADERAIEASQRA